MVLQCAANIYRLYGYNGGAELALKLTDVQDLLIQDIGEREFSRGGDHQVLLPNYEWHYELDTRIFEDKADLMAFYNSVLKDIYWSLGNPDYTEAEIAGMLAQQGWDS